MGGQETRLYEAKTGVSDFSTNRRLSSIEFEAVDRILKCSPKFGPVNKV
jgi:hypothetical protein